MNPCLFTVLLISLTGGVYSAPEEEQLRSFLAGTYGEIRRQSLPVEKLGDVVSVKHGLTLLNFNFDSDSKLFDGTFWPQMSWTDAGLTWDPSAFGGIETLRMDIKNIWMHDVVSYNKMVPGVREDQNSLAIVYSTGNVLWVPPSYYKVHCSNKEEDVEGSPDGTEYVCKQKFGSWAYSLNEMDIVLYGEPVIDMSVMTENPGWEVTFTSVVRNEAKYDCCPEKYPNLEYKIGLKCRGKNHP